MRSLPLLVLLAATACGGRAGRGSGFAGGCPRVVLPDEIIVEDARFDAPTWFGIEIVHECARGGVVELSEISLGDLGAFSFREPPPRQVQPETTRRALLAFAPTYPTYSYETELVLGYGDDRVVRTKIIARAHPDQDGDGVHAEQAGGTDCNDLDARVQVAGPEQDDGLDNDCDGMVDEDFMQAGSLRLTEVMNEPRAARAEFGQYVEVLNVGDREVNLRGVRVEHDEGAVRVVDDVTLSPDAFAVLGFEEDTSLNGGIELDGLIAGELIPDRPTRLALVADVTHSEARFESWPGNYGISAEVDHRVAVRDRDTTEAGWCGSEARLGGAARGTPGSMNRTCPDTDYDGDGLSANEGDCDDDRAEVRPGGTEAWNGLDDNCDGLVDMMWVEDRLEDEILGVFFGSAMALGGPDDSGRDRLAVHTSTDIFLVEGGGTWGAQVDTVASASIALGGVRTDVLLPELADLGTGDGATLLLGVGEASGPLRVLDLPRARGESEHDLAVLDVAPPQGWGVPAELRAGDLDGDGASEVLLARDAVRVLDLAGSDGSVDEADVLESLWRVPPAVSGLLAEPTDLDDDGFDDLAVSYVDGAGPRTWFVRGQASLPAEADVGASATASFPGLDLRVVDADGDGSRELVALTSSALVRYDGPLSGLVDDTPDRVLQLPPQHSTPDRSIGQVDVDGDPYTELLFGSVNSAGGRAWFVDRDALVGTGEADLAAIGPSQWAPIRVTWTWLGGFDHDGDGRDSLLFWASDGRIQRIPPKP